MEGLIQGLRTGGRVKAEIGDGTGNFDLADQGDGFARVAAFADPEGLAAGFDGIGQAVQPVGALTGFERRPCRKRRPGSGNGGGAFCFPVNNSTVGVGIAWDGDATGIDTVFVVAIGKDSL